MLQPDCEISRFVKCLKISVNSWNDQEDLSPNLTKPNLTKPNLTKPNLTKPNLTKPNL